MFHIPLLTFRSFFCIYTAPLPCQPACFPLYVLVKTYVHRFIIQDRMDHANMMQARLGDFRAFTRRPKMLPNDQRRVD
jgi:hypothetical protein